MSSHLASLVHEPRDVPYPGAAWIPASIAAAPFVACAFVPFPSAVSVVSVPFVPFVPFVASAAGGNSAAADVVAVPAELVDGVEPVIVPVLAAAI